MMHLKKKFMIFSIAIKISKGLKVSVWPKHNLNRRDNLKFLNNSKSHFFDETNPGLSEKKD